MYLCISGFLRDGSDDDSLKFELKINEALTRTIVELLGHRSINAMAAGEWLLADEQVAQLSSVIGQPLPTDLKLLIGLEA